MRHEVTAVDVNDESWDAPGFERPTDLPARTEVDYSRSKIASRLAIGLVCLAGCTVYIAWDVSSAGEVSTFAVVVGVLLAGIGLWFTIVSVYHLFVRKPLIAIDAEGLSFLRYDPIRWQDVETVRVLTEEPAGQGRTSHILKVVPRGRRRPFEIPFTTTTTEPEELALTLRSYVAGFREACGLSTGPG
jgi:hypothetical protein